MKDLKTYRRPVLRRLGAVDDVTQQLQGQGGDAGPLGFDFDGSV